MWSKARDLSTSRRVIHSSCGQTTPRWAYSRDMEPSPLSIQSKTPGSGVGKNPSQPLCNLRPCASRRTSHTPRSRTPIAPPIISAGQSVTANIDQNPPARHNHRRATPEEKHTKIALCGFSSGLTMKCEPSHRMVWYSTNHENRHFPTIPEAPQYPPRPHQPQNRIKSRGVVQPATTIATTTRAEIAAIRDSAKISSRRPKPGDCEFGARKGRAERSHCPINTPAIHPGKTHFRPLNPMIAHRKSRGTAGANAPNPQPNPSQAHPRH